jgi:hypothetical protein
MKLSSILLLTRVFSLFTAVYAQQKPIVHDAEYYILAVQNGKKWTAQGKDIQAKLDVLGKSTRINQEPMPSHLPGLPMPGLKP